MLKKYPAGSFGHLPKKVTYVPTKDISEYTTDEIKGLKEKLNKLVRILARGAAADQLRQRSKK